MPCNINLDPEWVVSIGAFLVFFHSFLYRGIYYCKFSCFPVFNVLYMGTIVPNKEKTDALNVSRLYIWFRKKNMYTTTIVNQYSAVWSNSADRFCIYPAVWLNIQPSSFLFIRPSGLGLSYKSVRIRSNGPTSIQHDS